MGRHDGADCYGITEAGGAGYGTVFAVKPTGEEHVVYAFKGGTDGADPAGSLLAFKGALWGTTVHGGTAGDGACNGGCGTVLKL